jgi:hypothetical protein
MKTTILALATAVTVAAGTLAPAPAEARGGRVAAGIIGGLAAGAIIGGALSHRPAYGYPSHGYSQGYPGHGYYEPTYARQECQIRRERFWDGYGWRIRRVQVCY